MLSITSLDVAMSDRVSFSMMSIGSHSLDWFIEFVIASIGFATRTA